MGYYTLSSFQIKDTKGKGIVECAYTKTQTTNTQGQTETTITFNLYTRIVPPASSTNPSSYRVNFDNSGKNSKFVYRWRSKNIDETWGEWTEVTTVNFASGFNIEQNGSQGRKFRGSCVKTIKHKTQIQVQLGFYWTLGSLGWVKKLSNSSDGSGFSTAYTPQYGYIDPIKTFSTPTTTKIELNFNILQKNGTTVSIPNSSDLPGYKWYTTGGNVTKKTVTLTIKKSTTTISQLNLPLTQENTSQSFSNTLLGKLGSSGTGSYSAVLKITFNETTNSVTATAAFTIVPAEVKPPTLPASDGILLKANSPIYEGSWFDLSGTIGNNQYTQNAPGFYYTSFLYKIEIRPNSSTAENELTKIVLGEKTYQLTKTVIGSQTVYYNDSVQLTKNDLSYDIYNKKGGKLSGNLDITVKDSIIDGSKIKITKESGNSTINISQLDQAISDDVWGWLYWQGATNQPFIYNNTQTYTCRPRLVIQADISCVGTDGKNYRTNSSYAKTYEVANYNYNNTARSTVKSIESGSGALLAATPKPTTVNLDYNFNFPTNVSMNSSGSEVKLTIFLQVVRGNQQIGGTENNGENSGIKPSDLTNLNIQDDKQVQISNESDPVGITGSLLVKGLLSKVEKSDEGTLDVVPVFDFGRSDIKFNLPAYFDQIHYKHPKILWQGANRLGSVNDDNQYPSIVFSQPVSDQLNGIVLVFSRMDGNAAGNWGWQSFFVPKQVVAQHPNGGHVFELKSVVNNGGDSIDLVKGYKYIYIGNSSLTGQKNSNGNWVSVNIKSSPPSYQNDRFTLRYVLGV